MHLPCLMWWEFHCIGMRVDLEAIKFSYILEVIKTLTAQLLNQQLQILVVAI